MKALALALAISGTAVAAPALPPDPPAQPLVPGAPVPAISDDDGPKSPGLALALSVTPTAVGYAMSALALGVMKRTSGFTLVVGVAGTTLALVGPSLGQYYARDWRDA